MEKKGITLSSEQENLLLIVHSTDLNQNVDYFSFPKLADHTHVSKVPALFPCLSRD